MFDKFRWLLSLSEVKKGILPDENTLQYTDYGFSVGMPEVYIVEIFYSRYIRVFGRQYIESQLQVLSADEVAKTWAKFALNCYPAVVKYDNQEFQERLEDLQRRVHSLSHTNLALVSFKHYMPFISSDDIFRYALDHLNSPLFKYFYLLLILWYEEDYPIDKSLYYPRNYTQCKQRHQCRYKDKCKLERTCLEFMLAYGTDYDYPKELQAFQKKITLSFLSVVPMDLKEKALSKLYESFHQINQTNLFSSRLCLSFEKTMYENDFPLTGTFFISWDKVEFYDGFYILKHPQVSFNSALGYKVIDNSARKVYNEISSYFMKHLPAIQVQSQRGKIVKVFNQSKLASCISMMEHKINVPQREIKRKFIEKRHIEKKELHVSIAKGICKEYMSRYLDYLCNKQLEDYNVVCCIEHRVNASRVITSEYSFIFTIKKTPSKLILAYENASKASRCTYLLPIYKLSWKESIDRLYAFFASNEVNKRQLMAARLADLRLPGNYAYERVYHADYMKWVDRVKLCM